MSSATIGDVTFLFGDCRMVLPTLPTGSMQTCVTSPPYFGLRDYGVGGQMGLEATPAEFVAGMVAVFREVRRVLADDGTLWLNLGDSYAAARGGTHQPAETLAGGKGGKTEDGGRVNRGRQDGYNPSRNASAIGLKHKDLIGTPWRVAFALQADGWFLRQDIIWAKPNPMPESVRDRCTKAHEYVFLLSKSERYYFDADAIMEPAVGNAPGNKTHKHAKAWDGGDEKFRTKAGLAAVGSREFRNKRSVWTVPTRPLREAHFATFPERLIEPCILAGSRPGSTVLDPFSGAGTTAICAARNGRNAVGVELNQEYIDIAQKRVEREIGWLK